LIAGWEFIKSEVYQRKKAGSDKTKASKRGVVEDALEMYLVSQEQRG